MTSKIIINNYWPIIQFSFTTHTGGPSVENFGNVLGNRTQAWSLHLKKAKSQNLKCFTATSVTVTTVTVTTVTVTTVTVTTKTVIIEGVSTVTVTGRTVTLITSTTESRLLLPYNSPSVTPDLVILTTRRGPFCNLFSFQFPVPLPRVQYRPICVCV